MFISISGLAFKFKETLELVDLIYAHIICVQRILHKFYYRSTYMHGYMTFELLVGSPRNGLMKIIHKDIVAAQIIEQLHNIIISIRNCNAKMIICDVYRPNNGKFCNEFGQKSLSF
ncbi:hypothetical protein PAEPH01_1648 [Pancytospora epiphaga]|nr:hypothetical protein PAEPH01_1648 [Pancytospora epiphaga]